MFGGVYTERYVYQEVPGDREKTKYDMFLYENPGLKKVLRFKLHNWGVEHMTAIMRKEQEIKLKIKETKQ